MLGPFYHSKQIQKTETADPTSTQVKVYAHANRILVLTSIIRLPSLVHHPLRSLHTLGQIFCWQAQNAIGYAMSGLRVAQAVWIEDACVHGNAETLRDHLRACAQTPSSTADV
jgi:hypothetical protein